MRHSLQKCFLAAALVVSGVASPLCAAELHQVSSVPELQHALENVSDGMTVTLAPGDYGALFLKRFTVNAPVTIRSKDLADPARFSGMDIRDVSGLTLENVIFDYDFQAGDKLKVRPFRVRNSKNITIRGALFEGDVARGRSSADNGFPTGFALGVYNSSDILLERNEIRNFYRGTVISQSQNVTVRGNNLHSIRMDGMNFAQVQNVRVEQNYIHDFLRSLNSKDHSDMIQFWTRNTTSPSRDVTIRDNVLSSGKGLYTQSIFMRNDQVDQGLAGDELLYRNITIENNTIINAHLHGITVGETDGLFIRNNTVVRNPTSEGKANKPALWTPQIRVAEGSKNVEISRNVISKIVGYKHQSDWIVDRNFFVQNAIGAGPGYYEAVFGPLSVQNPTSPASFAPRKGGPLDNTGIGSSLSLPE